MWFLALLHVAAPLRLLLSKPVLVSLLAINVHIYRRGRRQSACTREYLKWVRLNKLDEEDLRSLLAGSLPAWIKFREYEKAEFLNNAVQVIWPFLDSLLSSVCKSSLESAIRASLPAPVSGFSFDKFSFGMEPFQIRGVMHGGTGAEEAAAISFILEAEWVCKPDIVGKFTATPGTVLSGVGYAMYLQVDSFKAKGRVRLTFPIQQSAPLFSGMSFTFMEVPEIDLSVKLPGGLSLPLPQEWIAQQIRTHAAEALTSTFYCPFVGCDPAVYGREHGWPTAVVVSDLQAVRLPKWKEGAACRPAVEVTWPGWHRPERVVDMHRILHEPLANPQQKQVLRSWRAAFPVFSEHQALKVEFVDAAGSARSGCYAGAKLPLKPFFRSASTAESPWVNVQAPSSPSLRVSVPGSASGATLGLLASQNHLGSTDSVDNADAAHASGTAGTGLRSARRAASPVMHRLSAGRDTAGGTREVWQRYQNMEVMDMFGQMPPAQKFVTAGMLGQSGSVGSMGALLGDPQAAAAEGSSPHSRSTQPQHVPPSPSGAGSPSRFRLPWLPRIRHPFAPRTTSNPLELPPPAPPSQSDLSSACVHPRSGEPSASAVSTPHSCSALDRVSLAGSLRGERDLDTTTLPASSQRGGCAASPLADEHNTAMGAGRHPRRSAGAEDGASACGGPGSVLSGPGSPRGLLGGAREEQASTALVTPKTPKSPGFNIQWEKGSTDPQLTHIARANSASGQTTNPTVFCSDSRSALHPTAFDDVSAAGSVHGQEARQTLLPGERAERRRHSSSSGQGGRGRSSSGGRGGRRQSSSGAGPGTAAPQAMSGAVEKGRRSSSGGDGSGRQSNGGAGTAAGGPPGSHSSTPRAARLRQRSLSGGRDGSQWGGGAGGVALGVPVPVELQSEASQAAPRAAGAREVAQGSSWSPEGSSAAGDRGSASVAGPLSSRLSSPLPSTGLSKYESGDHGAAQPTAAQMNLCQFMDSGWFGAGVADQPPSAAAEPPPRPSTDSWRRGPLSAPTPPISRMSPSWLTGLGGGVVSTGDSGVAAPGIEAGLRPGATAAATAHFQVCRPEDGSEGVGFHLADADGTRAAAGANGALVILTKPLPRTRNRSRRDIGSSSRTQIPGRNDEGLRLCGPDVLELEEQLAANRPQQHPLTSMAWDATGIARSISHAAPNSPWPQPSDLPPHTHAFSPSSVSSWASAPRRALLLAPRSARCCGWLLKAVLVGSVCGVRRALRPRRALTALLRRRPQPAPSASQQKPEPVRPAYPVDGLKEEVDVLEEVGSGACAAPRPSMTRKASLSSLSAHLDQMCKWNVKPPQLETEEAVGCSKLRLDWLHLQWTFMRAGCPSRAVPPPARLERSGRTIHLGVLVLRVMRTTIEQEAGRSLQRPQLRLQVDSYMPPAQAADGDGGEAGRPFKPPACVASAAAPLSVAVRGESAVRERWGQGKDSVVHGMVDWDLKFSFCLEVDADAVARDTDLRNRCLEVEVLDRSLARMWAQLVPGEGRSLPGEASDSGSNPWSDCVLGTASVPLQNLVTQDNRARESIWQLRKPRVESDAAVPGDSVGSVALESAWLPACLPGPLSQK